MKFIVHIIIQRHVVLRRRLTAAIIAVTAAAGVIAAADKVKLFQNHLGDVALAAVLGLVIPRLQAAVERDLAPLAQILADDFRLFFYELIFVTFSSNSNTGASQLETRLCPQIQRKNSGGGTMETFGLEKLGIINPKQVYRNLPRASL